MNKVSIFEHPEFGRIRTLEIDENMVLRLGCCRRTWLLQSERCRRKTL